MKEIQIKVTLQVDTDVGGVQLTEEMARRSALCLAPFLGGLLAGFSVQ